MSESRVKYEQLQVACARFGCGVQDLFLVGDRMYVALGDSDARSYPREFHPFQLDDPILPRDLSDIARRFDLKSYESLDELREMHAQSDEFYRLYQALYDSLTDFSAGTAPDGHPLFLPGGDQGVPEIQFHVQSRELLTQALIERLQGPLLKCQRKWKICVTTGELGNMRTIAEIYKDGVGHAR